MHAIDEPHTPDVAARIATDAARKWGEGAVLVEGQVLYLLLTTALVTADVQLTYYLLLTRSSTCGRRSRHSTSTRCVPSTEPSTTGYSFSSVELISTKPSTNVSEPFMHMSHVSGRFDEPRDPTACGVCVVVLSSVSLYRVCAGGV